MLDALFKFPIIQLDGQHEREKEKVKNLMGGDEDSNLEFFIMEAEVPYWDFLNIVDFPLPTPDSREDAKDGVYKNCQVSFIHSGTFIVPWNKDKFKHKLVEFAKVQKEKEDKEKGGIVVRIPRKKKEDG